MQKKILNADALNEETRDLLAEWCAVTDEVVKAMQVENYDVRETLSLLRGVLVMRNFA